MQNGFSKSKTIDMLLNAYGEKAMKKQQSTYGINVSKRAEKISRMISAAAVQASLRHLTSPPSQLLDNNRRIMIKDIVAKTD